MTAQSLHSFCRVRGMAGKRTAREQPAAQPAAAQPAADPEPVAVEPEQSAAEHHVAEHAADEIEVLADDAEAVDGDLQAYGQDGEEDDELEDEEDDDGVFGEALFDPMMLTQQLTQLLVTEDGVPAVDVLQGISDALDKQNKILYKLASVIEAHGKRK